MPGLRAAPQHCQTQTDIDTNPPDPKKPKMVRADLSNGDLRLKWSVKNRVDYQPPLLRQPYGVAINSDVIVTAEGLWPHSRVQVFDHNGHSIRQIAQGQVLPYDVALTADGLLLTTDHNDRTIKAYTVQEGDLKFSWERNRFVWPNGLALTPTGHVVVADWSKGRVFVCDAESGREISSFRALNNYDHSTVCCPDRVAVDGHGRVIVTDAFSGSIRVFDVQRNQPFLFQIGGATSSSNSPGGLVAPKGVAVDSQNNIIVADCDLNAVKMYSGAHGCFIRDIVTPDMGLSDPLAIGWNDTGDVPALVVTEHRLNSSPRMKFFTL